MVENSEVDNCMATCKLWLGKKQKLLTNCEEYRTRGWIFGLALAICSLLSLNILWCVWVNEKHLFLLPSVSNKAVSTGLLSLLKEHVLVVFAGY